MVEPFKGKREAPETKVRGEIITFLEHRQWYVKILHGGVYQSGFPDLFATHKNHGIRLIEVKLPNMSGSRFTKHQRECFPLFVSNGAPIWILTAATEYEYRKLFAPCNWMEYFLLKG